jgi:hypothetical protein
MFLSLAWKEPEGDSISHPDIRFNSVSRSLIAATIASGVRVPAAANNADINC